MEFAEESQAIYRCENCSSSAASDNVYCTSCGYPILGSQEEKSRYILRVSSRKRLLHDAKLKVKEARTAIFVLAGLTLVFGLIAEFASDDTATAIVSLVLCLFYLIMGVWSNKNAFGAILVSFIVYITLNILNAIVDPATLVQGIIIKIIFILAFIKGIRSASEAQRLMKELEVYNAEPVGSN